jgi:hypothetical protein
MTHARPIREPATGRTVGMLEAVKVLLLRALEDMPPVEAQYFLKIATARHHLDEAARLTHEAIGLLGKVK